MIPLPLLEEFVGAPEGEKGSRRRAIRGREIGRLRGQQDPSEEKHLRSIIPGCTGACAPRTNLASLTRLTRATKQFQLDCAGLEGPAWIRTRDLRIMSSLL
jgi:hypothetical protein